MTSVLILDCETTGIGKDDEPISVGMVAFTADEKGRVVGSPAFYEWFRYPDVPIHPRAAEVHRISEGFLSGKDFDYGAILLAIEKSSILISHNADFDSRMLGRFFPEMFDKSWRCSWKQWPWPSDTPNKKLDSACSLFNVERPTAHGALKDAKALFECLMQQTGKTERSSTYLKRLMDRPEFKPKLRPVRPWVRNADLTISEEEDFTPPLLVAEEKRASQPLLAVEERNTVAKENSKSRINLIYGALALGALFLLLKCSSA